MKPPAAAKERPPRWPARVPLAAGFLAIATLVSVLGIWGMQARLAAAVVAPGAVQVESNRQVVQHLDGGVVGEILVKEGDSVTAGQVLIRLDGSRLTSELSVVTSQLDEIAARRARLEAERDGTAEIAFPETLSLRADGNPAVARLIAGERALFEARNEALAQESDLLAEQNRQIGDRIRGIEAQLAALRTQADLLREDLADQEALLAQRLTQATRVSDLQRQVAEAAGQIGRLEAEIAELRGQSAGNGIARLQLGTKRREEAVTALRDLEFRQIELVERRIALEETLSRLEIRSPVSGVVYDSRVFAVQSVIRPADPLMYIIPQDRPLVVAARVPVTAIDQVFVGQEASLRFSAFDQRQAPPVPGRVARVSADAIVDEATRQSYYAAEILPDPEGIAALGNQTLLPGMPVEAFIRTGERSPFAYLTQPLTVFFGRAFRE